MAYTRRRRHETKSEINIVPFLDVLLVLLLIFMATAPIISQSVQVDLPDSAESSAVETKDDRPPVILEVSGVDQYAMSIDGKRDENLSADQVMQNARLNIGQGDQKTTFLVGGAKDVPYEEVIKALNLLHEAGVTSVGLMTNPI
ncbi:MAG: colicin uptake protein TolR [Plesiomonas sp.]|uniref:colicin uptake protein TolR n=1 Tax=Plesiomonas sp. TaxID=2486279 RepID=UPI003F3BB280